MFEEHQRWSDPLLIKTPDNTGWIPPFIIQLPILPSLPLLAKQRPQLCALYLILTLRPNLLTLHHLRLPHLL